MRAHPFAVSSHLAVSHLVGAALCLATLLPSTPAFAASGSSEFCGAADSAVARIEGQKITLAEIEEQVGAQLRGLDQQRRELLEAALDQLIDERLLELEAERLELTKEALLAKSGGSSEIGQAEVDEWYEANKARVRQPKAEVEEQIRTFLAQQRALEARSKVVSGLEGRYAVERLLEPYRIEVGEASGSVRGSEGAPVTLTIFSDFQCPYCKRLAPALDTLEERFGSAVRISFRHFPLDNIHPDARRAAEATVCADRQDRMWAMHDAIFEGNADLSAESLGRYAREIGLDGERFDACLGGGEGAEVVARDLAQGYEAGVTGTPALFVNGRPVTLRRGRATEDQVGEVIADELKRVGGSGELGR